MQGHSTSRVKYKQINRNPYVLLAAKTAEGVFSHETKNLASGVSL